MDFTMEALEERAMGTTTACDAATQRWEDARDWAQRFMYLVYAVGIAVTAAVVILIVMALLGKPAGAIASAIAGIVTGGAMLFVIKERNRAATVEKNALAVMNKLCKS